MSYDPYGNDEFLGTGHVDDDDGWPAWAAALAGTLIFLAVAIGFGGGIGWLIARYGPETAFDLPQPYFDWAAKVAVKCPTTTESIRPLLADDRLTRDEMQRMRTIYFEGREVCDAPPMPSDD